MEKKSFFSCEKLCFFLFVKHMDDLDSLPHVPENAPPETALDRRWQSFPIVRRVRAKFAPFIRAEEKLTELIKEESKKKEEGE